MIIKRIYRPMMFRTYYSGSYPVVLIVVLILESPLTPYQPDLDKASHLNLKMTPLNKINNGNVTIEIRVLQNLVSLGVNSAAQNNIKTN